MTYEPMHHDPDAEPLLCSDEELAEAGFTVGYCDEMPETDGELLAAYGQPRDADTDAFLAAS